MDDDESDSDHSNHDNSDDNEEGPSPPDGTNSLVTYDHRCALGDPGSCSNLEDDAEAINMDTISEGSTDDGYESETTKAK